MLHTACLSAIWVTSGCYSRTMRPSRYRSSLVRSWFIVDGAGGVRSGTKNEDATRRVLAYFGIEPKAFDRLKELDKEICHYLNVQVTLKDVSELQNDVNAVHALVHRSFVHRRS
jgi:hypothetical protein